MRAVTVASAGRGSVSTRCAKAVDREPRAVSRGWRVPNRRDLPATLTSRSNWRVEEGMRFTITKVAWYTQRADDAFSRDAVLTQFRTLARFLDENGLSTRKLLDPSDRELDDEFAIASDDLTEEGMEFIRGGYERWLNALDRGKSPADTTFLERALAKQRAGKKRGAHDR